VESDARTRAHSKASRNGEGRSMW